MIPTINFIGCGRVGKTIAKLLSTYSLATIHGILTSSLESTEKSIQFIGEGFICTSLKELPSADIFFIATPDDLIETTCQLLSEKTTLKKETIIAHFSGSLSSTVLESAKKAGCRVASLHPLKSFAQPLTDFSGIHCAIEGDEVAISVLTSLFKKLGAILFEIKKENKTLYHAASVIANNYLVTLHYHAVQCFKAANITEEMANQLTSALMNNALEHLNHLTHEKALTGPLQRGDIQTITHHISALKLYCELSLKTLDLTTHSPEKKQVLEKLLT